MYVTSLWPQSFEHVRGVGVGNWVNYKEVSSFSQHGKKQKHVLSVQLMAGPIICGS